MAETKEPRGKLHLYLRQPVRKKKKDAELNGKKIKKREKQQEPNANGRR